MTGGPALLLMPPERPADSRDANSNSPPGGLRESRGQREESRLGTSAKIAAILLLPIALAACADSEDGKSITYTDDRGVANQPFPNNYKLEILSFMKTYLNNPVGVHEAAMAEPVQRIVGGRLRYVSLPALHPARIRRQLS